MSSTACAGCNRDFTHAGFSRHLSLTTRTHCRSHYICHLANSAAYDFPGVSGPTDADPSGGSGLEIGDPCEHIFQFNHTSN
jgi:hypothetical protein